MKYQIQLVTTEHLGTHGREVRIAFDPIEGETVVDMLLRISRHADKYAGDQGRAPMFATVDHVELRLDAREVAE